MKKREETMSKTRFMIHRCRILKFIRIGEKLFPRYDLDVIRKMCYQKKNIVSHRSVSNSCSFRF